MFKPLVPPAAVLAAVPVLFLSACGGSSSPPAGQAAAEVPPVVVTPTGRVAWTQPATKAVCGAGDMVEPALQGQVPVTDRQSGRSQQGYNCNLDLVAQLPEQGAGWQFDWYEDCGYMGTASGDGQTNLGVVVIDGSDPENPMVTDYLDSVSMIDPWESLKVNEARGLLAAVNGAGGGGGPEIDIYDISADCAHPTLLASTELPGTTGHEGNFAPDGLTYWSSAASNQDFYWATDLSDPATPELVGQFTIPAGLTHGLSLSDDGNTGYFVSGRLGPRGGGTGEENGLVIVDTSDVQAREASPSFEVLGTYYWDDGSETAQHTIPVSIDGRSHLVFVDEAGGSGKDCSSGLAPYAFARIVDIQDPRNPFLVAHIKLETHLAENCAMTGADYVGQVLFGYDSHYCSVDDRVNTTTLACGFFNSGIRVFDIRDPYEPKEIAYYNPPAQTGSNSELPGSFHATFAGVGSQLTADWCSAQVRLIPERREIWTSCQDNGFMVLRFREGVWPFEDTTG